MKKAIDNTEVIDGIAYEEEKLILQLYDHWEFTDEIEKDHMFLLQDNLNQIIKNSFPNVALLLHIFCYNY